MTKQLKFSILFTCFIVCSNAISMLGEKLYLVYNLQHKVGIPISQADFDSLVNRFTSILQKGDSIMTINDYVTLARLDNTIYYSELLNIVRYRQYCDLYSGKYANLTIAALSAKTMRGEYFYSKKFDFYFGGPLNRNSEFVVIQSR